jgi:hypothetical protein
LASSVELYLLALLTAGGWHADRSQTDLTTNMLGNSTTAADLTAAWTVPAYDASAGTVYTIEVPFTGTWESEILDVGLSLNGTFHNIVPIGGAFTVAGDGIAGIIRCRVMCTAAGSSGTIQADVEVSISDSSLNRLPTTTATGSGHLGSLAFSTTAANTVAVAAAWAATATGQTISGITSTLTRKGP